jgi:hypothetical protein
MQNARQSCQIVLKREFSQQIFEKYSTIKSHINPSSDSRAVPCGQTDGQTDRQRHDDSNSRFSQFCTRAQKPIPNGSCKNLNKIRMLYSLVVE